MILMTHLTIFEFLFVQKVHSDMHKMQGLGELYSSMSCLRLQPATICAYNFDQVKIGWGPTFSNQVRISWVPISYNLNVLGIRINAALSYLAKE